mmetsp:Transcript_55547/g.172377  ORF Transcript_55547/g.172377 Transcript_55547/m.172377 type:complete len:215 (+) Transcript_55547:539-1183(+)
MASCSDSLAGPDARRFAKSGCFSTASSAGVFSETVAAARARSETPEPRPSGDEAPPLPHCSCCCCHCLSDEEGEGGLNVVADVDLEGEPSGSSSSTSAKRTCLGRAPESTGAAQPRTKQGASTFQQNGATAAPLGARSSLCSSAFSFSFTFCSNGASCASSNAMRRVSVRTEAASQKVGSRAIEWKGHAKCGLVANTSMSGRRGRVRRAKWRQT